MRPVVLTTLCLAACTQAPPTGEQPAQPLATEEPPFCAFTLSQPVAARAELDGYFGPRGEDCVPPEGGEMFRLALGLPGYTLVARTPRPARLGERLPLDGWTSVSVNGDSDCSGWLRVSADVPDWALDVDAACAGGARLAGRFEGHYPAEWRR
jgi:hypothetical protein